MIVRERRAAEELARVLDGAMPVADASGRSRRLAGLASHVDEHTSLVEPDAAFSAALRRQLCQQIDALGAPAADPTLRERAAAIVRHRTARARHSAKLAVASGVASSLLGTAGVAVAAEEALPGETLYPVKRTTESVRLALAGDLTTEGRLHLAFAAERLEELRLSIGRLSAEQAIATLDDMDAATVGGSDELLTAGRTLDQPELFEEVDRFRDRQATGLAALIDDLPIAARGHARASLQLLQRLRAQVLTAVPAACEDCGLSEAAGALADPAGVWCDCARDADGASAASEDDRDRVDGSDDGRDGTSTVSSPRASDTPTDPSGGSLGDAVDDTADAVDDADEDTTDELDDATSVATSGATDAVDDTVDRTRKQLGETADDTLSGDSDDGGDLADLLGD